jgi:integrase/recombinase XerC
VRPNKSKGVHSLRHSFAINLYKKSRDVRFVQVCMGHRNINNTMVYADFVDENEIVDSVLGEGLYCG